MKRFPSKRRRNSKLVSVPDDYDVRFPNFMRLSLQGRPSANEISRMLQHIDEYNESLTDSSRKIKTSVELEKARPQLGKFVCGGQRGSEVQF